jgi:PAS domain S-box-containing protein
VVETGEPFFNEAVDFINVLGEDMLVRAFDMRVSKLDDGVEIVWRDITDRVRAERDRDWLAAIVESSVDAIIGSRPDGTIESWRAGAKRLYGYDAEEVIGKQYSVLFPEEVAELREQRFQQVLTGKTVGPIEATETRKDGSAVRVSYTASPIKGDSGEVIGVARIVREVPDLIADDRTTVADIADYAPRRRRPASN